MAIASGPNLMHAPAIAELDILWITAGLGCDGDTVAMTAATQPSIEDVLLGAIPGLPKVKLHNAVLAYRNGAPVWASRTTPVTDCAPAVAAMKAVATASHSFRVIRGKAGGFAPGEKQYRLELQICKPGSHPASPSVPSSLWS